MKVNTTFTPSQLVRKIERLWELSARKILSIEKESRCRERRAGLHRRRPLYGPRLDGVDAGFPVRLGHSAVRRHRRRPSFWRSAAAGRWPAMAPHVGHFGVHDHGFNNVSTYGNLLRLMGEGRIADDPWERGYYELALKLSGADPGPPLDENARRRRIHLFVQRPAFAVCRHDPLAALAGRRPQAGPRAYGKKTTARFRCWIGCTPTPRPRRRYSVYYGEGRDAYDVRGRVAHEVDLQHQRRQLTAARTRSKATRRSPLGRAAWRGRCADSPSNWSSSPSCRATTRPIADRPMLYLKAARATCDFYIDQATAADGIPYWDTGAPNLHRAGRLAGPARRSVQPARAGRQFGGGHRRAGPAAAGALLEADEPLLAGRPDGARHAVGRAVLEHRCRIIRG